MKHIFLFFIAIIFVSCSSKKSEDDYDLACDIFEEALSRNAKLTASSYLDLLKSKVGEDSEVFVAWSGLVYFEPKDRYLEFKSVAQKYSAPDWECKPMEVLAPAL